MSAAVEQHIQLLLAQSVQEGLLDDQFLQLYQLQVGAGRRAQAFRPRARLALGCARARQAGGQPCPLPGCAVQDESNPDFVSEVVELYFEDSAAKIDTLQARLSEPAPSYQQVRRGAQGTGWRAA